MPAEVDAPTLKKWLSDGSEIALIDVREAGQYGMGHPFFAVPLPYSRFEIGLAALAPNPDVRMVLCDDGDRVAQRAVVRAAALGYRNVFILAGGVSAWREAAHLYSARERAALAWAEAVTRLVDNEVPDAVYEQARAEFSEAELAQLTLAIVTINGWNRLNIAFRTPAGDYKSAAKQSAA